MNTRQKGRLSPALEDYLEAVWEILRERPAARVKLIAEYLGVKMGSVTPALKRLRDLGLVNYTARSSVELTEEGARQARRVSSRHRIVERFLVEFLGVSQENAARDACAMEHVLSNETVDRIVRWFEYLQRCDHETQEPVQQFHGCSLVHPGLQECRLLKHDEQEMSGLERAVKELTSMKAGEVSEVAQIARSVEFRGELLDKGFLPGRPVSVMSKDSSGVRVQVGDDQLVLTPKAASCVWVFCD